MSRHNIKIQFANNGFSLVELMISLTIGLVIMAAAMSAYVGSSSASKIAEAQSRMNEDAQAALAILSQQVRMAGNNPVQQNRVGHTTANLSSLHNPIYGSSTYTTSTLSAFSIRACDGNFTNLTTAANIDALTCTGNTTTLADSIAVNYEADRYNTSPTAAGTPTDCLGNALPTITANLPVLTSTSPVVTSTAAVTYTVADNRYYIGTSTVIVSPSLYCKGNGPLSTAQPLVENIDDLQFSFGTTSSAGTSTTATIAGYIDASVVSVQTAYAPATSMNNPWERVMAVRICVVVRSESAVAPTASSAQYLNCAGTLTTPNDQRLRRAYSTTVVLRNRVL